MNLLEKALEMLREYPLCDNCLGRQFALLGYGLTNAERGRAIKTALTLQLHEKALSGDEKAIQDLKTLAKNGASTTAKQTLEKLNIKTQEEKIICHLCQNVFQKIQEIAEKAAEKMEEYEYETFLVGVKIPAEIEEREDEFRARFSVMHAESLRNELSREIGKKLQEITGREVDFKKPQITVIVHPYEDRVELQIRPLFIAGRYKKLVRGIPQSRWICTQCMGRGCEKCNWTGKMYETSVEELIAVPMMRAAEGEDEALHAAGREDVDARVLGKGRPFIVEIKNPRKRSLNLKELEERINRESGGRVEVANLRIVERADVKRLKKGEGARKIYEAEVEFNRNISDEEVKRLEEALTGATINQWTPIRVLHRRANKLRRRKVYQISIKREAPNRLVFRIMCDGGLYIKELITGDEGRTQPSVSQLLNAKAKSIKLDVVDVLMEGY
ncbi:MAG TPA: tRNA pseudouridine(54/55) synthase Pus10 [Candidatus Bathyarchaeota archaeon]|nr:tRNA pseudouridine(54/55) synthase Pus10 [Candidatus Bathyarchaeota archaeon]